MCPYIEAAEIQHSGLCDDMLVHEFAQTFFHDGFHEVATKFLL